LIRFRQLEEPENLMFANDYSGLQKATHSKNWFSRGRDLLEEGRYEDALVCFEEAQRLGYPKSADAILICNQRLGLS
jgi:cytochrome c-type biogenesis protein CcmH/NrfG